MVFERLDLNKSNEEMRKIRRGVLWVWLALVGSGIGGLIALKHDTTQFIVGGGSDVRFTVVSRWALCLAIAFHALLAVGILLRRRFAWRAAFSLPLVWGCLCGIIAWPRFTEDPTAAIPYAFLAGIAFWNFVAWRKEWGACEPFFAPPLSSGKTNVS